MYKRQQEFARLIFNFMSAILMTFNWREKCFYKLLFVVQFSIVTFFLQDIKHIQNKVYLGICIMKICGIDGLACKRSSWLWNNSRSALNSVLLITFTIFNELWNSQNYCGKIKKKNRLQFTTICHSNATWKGFTRPFTFRITLQIINLNDCWNKGETHKSPLKYIIHFCDTHRN